MTSYDTEYITFLDNLITWMPWAMPQEMATHLKGEFPHLTLQESRMIADRWWLTKPKLLNE